MGQAPQAQEARRARPGPAPVIARGAPKTAPVGAFDPSAVQPRETPTAGVPQSASPPSAAPPPGPAAGGLLGAKRRAQKREKREKREEN
ncbi:MAG: hypothetical protein K8T90_15580 [Planctomycetes bacterium]|nr:hypothetical protein [Planctomycetota bacterium]